MTMTMFTTTTTSLATPRTLSRGPHANARPASSTRNELEAAYLKGQHDALSGRMPACPYLKDRTRSALYWQGYESLEGGVCGA